MEIDWIIVLIDILGSIGFGFYLSKDIRKDLKKAGMIGGYAPVIVFLATFIPSLLGMRKDLSDLVIRQFATLFVGWMG